MKNFNFFEKLWEHSRTLRRVGLVLVMCLITIPQMWAYSIWGAKTIYVDNLIAEWEQPEMQVYKNESTKPSYRFTQIGSTSFWYYYFSSDWDGYDHIYYYNYVNDAWGNKSTQQKYDVHPSSFAVVVPKSGYEGCAIGYFTDTKKATPDHRIYFDATPIDGWGSKAYLRYGFDCVAHADPMTKFPGTANLWYIDVQEAYYEKYTVANAAGYTKANTVYQPTSGCKPTGEYEITKSLNFSDTDIDGGSSKILRFVPTTKASTSDGCDWYNYTKTSNSSMPTQSVTIKNTTNGKIRVDYTNTSGTETYIEVTTTQQVITVPQSAIITVTAIGNTGYNVNTLSVGGAAFTSGNTYTVTAATTITATFVAKTYSISLDKQQGSSGSTSVTMTYNSSSHTSITAPTAPTGYTFAGWYTGALGTGTMIMNASGVLQASVTNYTGAGGIWTKDGTCTLYAKYTASYPDGYLYITDVKSNPEAGATAAISGATYNASLNGSFAHSGLQYWALVGGSSNTYTLTFASAITASATAAGVAVDVWWGANGTSSNSGTTIYLNGTDAAHKIGEAAATSDTRNQLLETLKDVRAVGTTSVSSLQLKRYNANSAAWFRVGIKEIPGYRLTYNVGDGTGAPSASYQPNATITLSSAKPTYAGHLFAGWQVNGSGTVYQPGDSFDMPAEATTLVAKWEEICFTATITKTSSSYSVDKNTTKDITSDASITSGGAIKIVNNDAGASNKSYGFSSDGMAIPTEAGYIEFTLPSGSILTTGSMIRVQGAGSSASYGLKIIDDSGTTIDSHSAATIDFTYTVTALSTINGKSYIRINKANSNNAKIKSVTVAGCGEVSCSATTPGAISKGSASGGTGTITLTASGSPATNNTWYWQSSSTGTDTSDEYDSGKDVSEAGTYYLRSYCSDGDGCWSDAVSVTVAAADLLTTPTATFSNGAYTIGSSALDLSSLWSSDSEGSVTYTVQNANGTGATISTAAFTATTAGTATVRASQAADGYYSEIYKDATITVSNPTYSVTYKANNSTAESDVVRGTESTFASNSTTIFTAPSTKAFAGWNTKADGSGTHYDVGDAVPSAITVYAEWWYKVYYIASSTSESNDITAALEDAKFAVSVKATTGTSYSASDYSDYALVVLSESLDGSKAGTDNHELKVIVGLDKPILNLKTYFYGTDGDASKRWTWGAPNAGKKPKCIYVKNDTYANLTSHPIYSGLTPDGSDSIQILKTPLTTKPIQPIGSFTSGKEGYTLALVPNNSSGSGTAIHEMTAAQRSTATGETITSKYLMISIQSGELSNLSDGGKKLIKNAADYLITGSQWVPQYKITHSAASDGSYTIQVGAGSATDDDTMSAAGTTITLDDDPDSGFELYSWIVTGAVSGDNITVTSNQFIMPAEAVTVAATFVESCSAPGVLSVVQNTGHNGAGSYQYGDDIILTASCADGTDASTTYAWYKGADWSTAKEAGAIQYAKTAAAGGTTYTKSAELSDAGTYWCEASNGSGCETHNPFGADIYVGKAAFTPDLEYESLPIPVGSTRDPVLTGVPVGAGTATYSSNNTSVAEVDSETGVVTAKAAGNATIRVDIAESANYIARYDTKLISVREAVLYTVTFDPNGGTIDESSDPVVMTQATEGAALTMPTPVHATYTFDGWYIADTEIGDEGAYTPTKDVTAYAKWIEECSGGGGGATVLFNQTFNSDGAGSVAFTANTARNYSKDGTTLTGIVGSGANLFTQMYCSKQSSSGMGVNNSTGGNSRDYTGKFGIYATGGNMDYHLIRSTNLASSAPTAIKVEFNALVADGGNNTKAMVMVAVGSGFSDETTNSYPSKDNVYAGFGVFHYYNSSTHTVDPCSYMATGQGNRFTTTGTITYNSSVKYTWVVNATGDDLEYDDPSSSTTTLATGKWDLWIGTTKVVSAQDRTTAKDATLAGTTMQNLYIGCNGTRGEFILDDFKVTDLAPSGGSGSCYRVNYHSNGADGGLTFDPLAYDEGDLATVVANGFTFEHETEFIGWNTAVDGSGTMYRAGDKLSISDDDIELYAQWMPINRFQATEDWFWNNEDNWSHGVLPSASHKVIIEKPCELRSKYGVNPIAKVKTVVIDKYGDNTGRLTIAGPAGLAVEEMIKTKNAEGELVGTSTTDLNIESSSDHENGALAVKGYTEEGGVDLKATVTPKTKARVYGWSVAGEYIGFYVNQFIGTPMLDAKGSDYYGSWLYRWDATAPEDGPDAGKGDWVYASGALAPFQGYTLLFDNHEETYLWLRGTLVYSDSKVFNLAYDARHENLAGTETMLANSYLAPIDVTTMTTTDFAGGDEDKMEATIYVFNSGTPNNWSDNEKEGKGNIGELPGQFLCMSINSAVYTGGITEISSMQAFSVYAKSTGATFNLDYERMVYNPLKNRVTGIAPMRAPSNKAAANDNAPDVMKIMVECEHGADKLFMLTREDFNAGFDNGWDARKMFGESFAPQLYAFTPDGNMSVNCVPDEEGAVLGFRKGSADDVYTISFTYNGEKMLYLNDTKEQLSTLISDDAEYTFISETGDTEARFIISETPYNAPAVTTGFDGINAEQKAKVHKVLINDHIYIIRGGRMYDATGKMLK